MQLMCCGFHPVPDNFSCSQIEAGRSSFVCEGHFRSSTESMNVTVADENGHEIVSVQSSGTSILIRHLLDTGKRYLVTAGDLSTTIFLQGKLSFLANPKHSMQRYYFSAKCSSVTQTS